MNRLRLPEIDLLSRLLFSKIVCPLWNRVHKGHPSPLIFYIYYPPSSSQAFQVITCFLVSTPKLCMHFLLLYACHTNLIITLIMFENIYSFSLLDCYLATRQYIITKYTAIYGKWAKGMIGFYKLHSIHTKVNIVVCFDVNLTC